MLEPTSLIIVFATFMLAGTVKGATGLGLPTVSLALLTVVFDMPTAIALLLIPSFVTNLWQGLVGSHRADVFRRCWPFLLPATLLVGVGAMALTRIDLALLSALLGCLLVIYAVISLAGFKLQIDAQNARWLGPVLGAVNGVLTGMTGSFVVPGVLYLQAIGLSRDQLIQAMGMLFTLSTLALAVVLQGNNLISSDQLLISSLALGPAIAGMLFGQQIRKRLSEQLFRKVFFWSLLLLGGYIITKALT